MCRYAYLGETQEIIDAQDLFRKNEFDEYKCLECLSFLILKCGVKNTPHFAHKITNKCPYARTPTYNGTNESEEHRDAKQLLAHMIKERRVIFTKEFVCIKCGGTHIQEYDTAYYNFDDVKLEKVLEGGGVADIAISYRGKTKFVVEVKHTHACESRNVDWIEIPTHEVNLFTFRYTQKVYEKCEKCKSIPRQCMVMFGKYRDQPLQVLLKDKNYVDWLIRSDDMCKFVFKNIRVM